MTDQALPSERWKNLEEILHYKAEEVCGGSQFKNIKKLGVGI